MKNILLIIPTVLLINYSNAQQQLQNPGFEYWEDSGTAEFEPINWSSLKTGDAMSGMAPTVLTREAGRSETGDWAIQLEVKDMIFVTANGIVTNGRIHADSNPNEGYVYTIANTPKWHTEFSDRPDSLVGWYKFEPVSGDSGKIEIVLHTGTEARLPRNAATTANEVGNVRYDFVTPQTSWTRFSQPFKYYGTENPEYVLTTIAAGDSTISKVGTKLWIDDLELIYNEEDTSVSTQENDLEELAVNGSFGYLYFEVENEDKIEYQVADVTGKVIQAGRAQAKTPFSHESGIYFIRVKTRNGVFTKKLFIQQ